jgi:hypothetical protein
MYMVQLITEADRISHFGFTTAMYRKTEKLKFEQPGSYFFCI